MVMYFVHIGRNEDKTQHPVNHCRQPDISMGECRDENKNCLKDHDGVHRGTGNKYSYKKEQPAQNALNGVMPETCRDVHIIVGVVYNMKSP